MICSMTAFAGTKKAIAHKNTKQRAPASDVCGDIDDGIAFANGLAVWRPETPRGDQANWYVNSTTHIQAALLQAKLKLNPSMSAAEKSAIQEKINGLCQSFD